MQEYHVYCLDLEGSNVDKQLIEAASDEEAIRRARTLQGLRHCEVWRGHQLVARVTEFTAQLSA